MGGRQSAGMYQYSAEGGFVDRRTSRIGSDRSYGAAPLRPMVGWVRQGGSVSSALWMTALAMLVRDWAVLLSVGLLGSRARSAYAGWLEYDLEQGG